MAMLIVDNEKCKKDGICAGDCPMAIIKLENDEGPKIVPGGDEFCLRCGHCVAVCPHGALSHREVPLEKCVPLHKDHAINTDQAIQFLRSRRSIRMFKDKAIEKDRLKQLIEIGRYAPTASNSQLVEWTVFTDKEKIHEIAGMVIGWMKGILEKDPQPAYAPYMPILAGAWDMGFDAVLRSAPGLIIASAPKEATNGLVDVTLALSYLELAAPSFGLGTCWAGLLHGAMLSHSPIREAVGITDNTPHHYPMMIGHPKVRYFRLPERKDPRIVWK
jgi:nitroreductase/NAD-dependent dihydropyrimidine dehydrogenase PreA subunit